MQSIARALRVSNNTVTAIAEQEWQQVEARKQILAARHERIADLGTEELINRLETKPRSFSNSDLNNVTGTSTDKVLALRGDNIQTIRHLHHPVSLTTDDIVAFAVARSKQHNAAQDKVVQPREIGDPSVGGFKAAEPKRQAIRDRP